MSESDVKARLSKFFTLGEPRTAGPGEPLPGERARGAGWILTEQADGPVLNYQRGEMGGGSKRLAITQAEADSLASGALTADSLILRYGAS